MAIAEASELELRSQAHQTSAGEARLHPTFLPGGTPLHCQGIHFVLRFPMTTAATKFWLALLATGGMMLTTSLIAPAAKAQSQPCMSGLLISTIVNAGPTGYSCDLGGINYTFYDSLTELENPLAMVKFQDSAKMQKITFDNLSTQDDVAFSYGLVSVTDIIEEVVLSYTQDPSMPAPLMESVSTTPILPANPSQNTIYVDTIFMPDTSMAPPYQTLTSMTHTIHKTPAPLPLAGAGLAFGFSRKLRRRIHQTAHKSASV
jgi:hypothetical protein